MVSGADTFIPHVISSVNKVLSLIVHNVIGGITAELFHPRLLRKVHLVLSTACAQTWDIIILCCLFG